MIWAAAAPNDWQRFSPEVVFAAGLANHHISNTAYPIAHQTTVAPYRARESDHRRLVQTAFADAADFCVYVHVPFCDTRCAFCEYTVVRRQETARAAEYVDALLAEIALWDAAIGLGVRRAHGFDIGGGTPTWLPLDDIARIVEAVTSRVRLVAGTSVSIETTPAIAAREPEKIAGLPRLGVDRISMGVQVAETALLGALGRERDGAEVQLRAAEHIHAAGFGRFNLDLIYGFADQSLDSWLATLEHAIALGPDAITLYRMRYKLTRISHQASRVTRDQVSALAALAKATLTSAGYQATLGKTTLSRIPGDPGTSSYLTRRVRDGMPYLGFGLGAQTCSDRTLSYNDGAVGKNLAPYSRSVASGRLPLQDLYDLPLEHAMAKMCAVSFYFGEIDCGAFTRKFGVDLAQAFPREIDFVTKRGLMQYSERSLRLTEAGAADLCGVIALFYAPSVQAHLIGRDPEDFSRERQIALRVAGGGIDGV